MEFLIQLIEVVSGIQASVSDFLEALRRKATDGGATADDVEAAVARGKAQSATLTGSIQSLRDVANALDAQTGPTGPTPAPGGGEG